MDLLPREDLVRTSGVDHADWNFTPLLGWLQRQRFELVKKLLGKEHFARLIEVGYGSGVFMPELAHRCNELFGIDVHDRTSDVTAVLSRHGITAKLHTGSITATPFPDDYFDAMVAISCLEYVDDIGQAAAEIRRILRPSGILVLVTPRESPILDFGLRLLTGERAEDNYADRRRRLVPALCEKFAIDSQLNAPRVLSGVLPVYSGLRLVCRK